MQYRKLGQTQVKVSALGFGCLRLPTLDGREMGYKINEDQAIRLLRRAIDGGVNLIDTGYLYHERRSELVVGKALGDGYRQRVLVSTHLPMGLVHTAEDFDRFLCLQLKRLRTDRIDLYLLPFVERNRRHTLMRVPGLLARAEKALREGRVGYLGFSFQGNAECFEEVAESTQLWSFCQLPLNYVDAEKESTLCVVQRAARKGWGVIVTQPLRGGRLIHPPANVRWTMMHGATRRTPVEWALHWLWDQAAVSTVLCGMGSMEEVEENLSVAEESRIHLLRAADHALIQEIRTLYGARRVVPCTHCCSCMPCPNGVNIPANFEFFNDAYLYDDVDGARSRYRALLPMQERSTACADCGSCSGTCPNKIPIGEWMPIVSSLLS